MSKSTGVIPNSMINAFICRPGVNEKHRVKNEVEFYHEAVAFAKKYNFIIKAVGKLQRNLKFTVTYIQSK